MGNLNFFKTLPCPTLSLDSMFTTTKRVNNKKIGSEFRHAKSVIIDTSALLASGNFFFTKKCLKLALKRLKVA